MSRSITEVAVDLLSRREHSVLEVRRKLQQRDFDEVEIDSLIEKLCSNNLLSNERFAETYINMRRQRGYGPVRIAQELKERGVDSDLSAAYLDELADEWQGIMVQQYRKKFGNDRVDEFKEKAKRMRFLQYRGYSLEMINQFINNQ